MAESYRNCDNDKPNDVDHFWRKVQNKKSTAATARKRKMTNAAINETDVEVRML
jgi:hypothetical protein